MSENTNVIALKGELDILLDDINISSSEIEFLKLTEMYCLNFINMKYDEQNEDMYNIERNVALNKIYKIAKNKNHEGIDKKIIWDIYQKAFREIKCEEMNNKTDMQVISENGVKISFKFDLDMRGLLAYDKNGDLSATDKGIELISNKFIEIFGIRSGRKSIDAFIPEEGIWTTTSQEWLPHIVSKTLIQKTNTYMNNKAIEDIAKRVKMNSFDLKYDTNLFNKRYMRITFKNGTLDLAEGKFYNQFFKEDYSTVKVPWNYKEELKNEKPLKLDNFLDLMLDQETKQLIYELLGAIFMKKYLPKKFFLLYGSGNNGKSTLLQLITALAGEGINVSYISLASISDAENRFHRIELKDKLVNVCGEIPPNYVIDTDILKMLTGTDTITAERKGVDPVRFENYANIFMSCNKVPRFSDHTKGFKERFTIIPMQKDFKSNVQDTNINIDNTHINDIVNDTALMENIIAYSIERFKLTQYGEKLTEPTAVEDILKEYYQEDPINAFLEDFYDITGDSKDRILCKNILTEFEEYKEREKVGNSSKFNANSFGRAIEERFTDEVTYKPKAKLLGENTTKANVLFGIKKKAFIEVEPDDQVVF
ncbi:DNA primase family protein [Intestinibacter sp.]|uniref:DNA primase family protein n=1 Tax=Intestinibacter sp. TaxID=1965304 RepID=UPI002A90DA2A|nr:phage/plasmid primase, P4 family [Intestinibacter sp.]MDY5212842.1 phage/plasmid primase, P4 family [Intestinibacter sp.]